MQAVCLAICRRNLLVRHGVAFASKFNISNHPSIDSCRLAEDCSLAGPRPQTINALALGCIC